MTPYKLCFDDFFLVSEKDFFSDHNIITCHLQQKSSGSNYLYLQIENKIGDTAIAVARRHGHLSIISIYIRVHHHTHFFHDKLDFQHLIDVTSQCGQFEVAYYLHSVYKLLDSMNNSQSESNFAECYLIHESDQHDQDIHISLI